MGERRENQALMRKLMKRERERERREKTVGIEILCGRKLWLLVWKSISYSYLVIQFRKFQYFVIVITFVHLLNPIRVNLEIIINAPIIFI
jgi:hypothetical protein